MLSKIIGDLPVISNNHKLLAKFYSGTLLDECGGKPSQGYTVTFDAKFWRLLP